MKRLLFVFFCVFISAPTFSQECSEWQNGICFSYCSDVWQGDGNVKKFCFNPNEATIEKPATLFFCFSDPSEQIVATNTPQFPFIKRVPQFNLCLPDGICQASVKLFSVTGSDIQVVEELIMTNPDVYVDAGNRDTPCSNCPNPNRYLSLPHRVSGNLHGKYKMEISYKCCDALGNVTGEGSLSFYYEIVDAASGVDVDLDGFLATNIIETINGDTQLDGFVPASGFPGPELGPASSGVRVSTSGGGISEYRVTLYEVDCGDPGFTVQLNSVSIPYNGNQIIEYNYLDIPNWQNIYQPNGCYKVEIEVVSICGTYKDDAYFTITDQCVFCFGNESSDERNSNNDDFVQVSIQPNPSNGLFWFETSKALTDLEIYSLDGRLIENNTTVQNQILLNDEGAYFAKFLFSNGETKIVRLIKH